MKFFTTSKEIIVPFNKVISVNPENFTFYDQLGNLHSINKESEQVQIDQYIQYLTTI